MESMIHTLLNNFARPPDRKGKEIRRSATPPLEISSEDEDDAAFQREEEFGAPGSSEKWWDDNCKSSEDEGCDVGGKVKSGVKDRNNEIKVCWNIPFNHE